MHTAPLPRLLSYRFFQLALLALGFTFSAGAVAQLPPPVIKPDSGPWDSGAGFHFDLGKKKLQKTRQSVSGMACNLDAIRQRICLMAFDEGAQARYAYVGNKVLTIDAEPVVLRASTGELDAEGAATDGRYFYVTGSHSAKRGDCASNPGSGPQSWAGSSFSIPASVASALAGCANAIPVNAGCISGKTAYPSS